MMMTVLAIGAAVAVGLAARKPLRWAHARSVELKARLARLDQRAKALRLRIDAEEQVFDDLVSGIREGKLLVEADDAEHAYNESRGVMDGLVHDPLLLRAALQLLDGVETAKEARLGVRKTVWAEHEDAVLAYFHTQAEAQLETREELLNKLEHDLDAFCIEREAELGEEGQQRILDTYRTTVLPPREQLKRRCEALIASAESLTNYRRRDSLCAELKVFIPAFDKALEHCLTWDTAGTYAVERMADASTLYANDRRRWEAFQRINEDLATFTGNLASAKNDLRDLVQEGFRPALGDSEQVFKSSDGLLAAFRLWYDEQLDEPEVYAGQLLLMFQTLTDQRMHYRDLWGFYLGRYDARVGFKRALLQAKSLRETLNIEAQRLRAPGPATAEAEAVTKRLVKVDRGLEKAQRYLDGSLASFCTSPKRDAPKPVLEEHFLSGRMRLHALHLEELQQIERDSEPPPPPPDALDELSELVSAPTTP